MKTLSRLLIKGASVVGALGAYEFLLKPKMFSWGATEEERSRTWPGDEFTPHPIEICTRAITIHAAPEHIWPWIMQIGQDRAGFYSYTWLENLFRAEMNNTFRLVAEWQDRKVGDDLWMAAQHHYGGRARMTIARIEPFRALVNVAYSDRDAALNVQWAPHGCWNFLLNPIAQADASRAATRLIMRSIRPENMSLAAHAATLFWDPAHFLMERKMMLTLKHLAERHAELEREQAEESAYNEAAAIADF